MKPVWQPMRPGEQGQCFRACLASLMEIEIDDIPPFELIGYDTDEALNEFFSGFGLTFLEQRGDEQIAASLASYSGESIVFGTSDYWTDGGLNKGAKHAVIFREGRIVHDPQPGGSDFRRPYISQWFLVPRSIGRLLDAPLAPRPDILPVHESTGVCAAPIYLVAPVPEWIAQRAQADREMTNRLIATR